MERNIDVQEKHRSVASHTPPIETWSTTQACAQTRNRTGDLLICGMMPNSQNHISQGYPIFQCNYYPWKK